MRHGWKAVERSAARLFPKGERYKANTGGRLDFDADGFCGQVKSRRTLSLAELEALAVEMERLGAQTSPPKIGVVVVKRSAGAGRATPHLVVLTEGAWRALNGRMPQEEEAA